MDIRKTPPMKSAHKRGSGWLQRGIDIFFSSFLGDEGEISDISVKLQFMY